LAGPRWAQVYLNGRLLGTFSTNTDQPINFRVFHADATSALHQGDNLLAIEAIRGRGVVSGAGLSALNSLPTARSLLPNYLAPHSATFKPRLSSSPTVPGSRMQDWSVLPGRPRILMTLHGRALNRSDQLRAT
jgi:hypothetical protein